MQRNLVVLTLVVLGAITLKAQTDAEGCKDYYLLAIAHFLFEPTREMLPTKSFL